MAGPAQADYYISIFAGMTIDASSDPFNIELGSNSSAVPDLAYGNTTFITAALWGNTVGGRYAYLSKVTHKGYYSGTQFNSFQYGTLEEDHYDQGFIVGAAVGRTFQEDWRMELEVSRRKADLGGNHRVEGTLLGSHYGYERHSWIGTVFYDTNTTGAPTSTVVFPTSSPGTTTRAGIDATTATAITSPAATNGKLTTYAFMANVWRDFDIFEDWLPVTPFVGAGLGAANVYVDYAGQVALPNTTVRVGLDEDEWAVAWQAGAGVSWDTRFGTLSAQYRYFGTSSVTINNENIGTSNHTGLIGITFPMGN